METLLTDMETFTEAKPFVDNPRYQEKRKEALNELDINTIDPPIVELIKDYAMLPHCFTLQSCYGHFAHEGQKDSKNVEQLSNYNESSMVDYRIAYIAFCIQNNDLGRKLYQDLKAITKIDPDYIQFGSADWFWQRNVNIYALQVEPDRYKTKDEISVSISEALHLEKARDQMFERLKKILQEHQQLVSK